MGYGIKIKGDTEGKIIRESIIAVEQQEEVEERKRDRKVQKMLRRRKRDKRHEDKRTEKIKKV